MAGSLDKYHFVPVTEEHAKLASIDYEAGKSVGITAIKNGKVSGVCVLDSWTENACSIHMKVPDKWAFKHGYLEEIFNFIFCESGRGVVVASPRSDNAQLKRFVIGLGFKRVGVIPNGYKVGVDIEINILLKENCRYITNGISRFVRKRCSTTT